MLHRRVAFLPVVLCMVAGGMAPADESARLDFSAWQRMPVFDHGRLMPLDTFARSVVEQVCGKTRPTFDPSGLPENAEARQLFPKGKPRKFDDAELLFSWLVEPDKWERVPFLIARHEKLRRDILQLPLRDEHGHRLKHVSPWGLLRATGYRLKLAELGQRERRTRAGEPQYDFSDVDKKINELYEAYTLYRLVTFDPLSPADSRGRFPRKLGKTIQTWNALGESLRRLPTPADEPDAELPLAEAEEAAQKLVSLMHEEDFSIEQADPLLVAFRRSATRLAERTDALCRKTFRDESTDRQHRAAINAIAAQTAELAQVGREMHMALYDNGRSLRVVPALNPGALRADRDVDDDNQPWLSLQALLLGSDALLEGYPKPELDAVRKAFDEVKAIYLDRGAADRPQRFAAAMEEFAAAVRTLGEEIEPARCQLPVPGNQEDRLRMLAETAYPPPGYTDSELHYNRLDPFLWSWVVCLMSTACFALSFGLARKPMFWLGVAALALAQGFAIYGLCLRWLVTGWVPVTNMFETVVFVGLVVALLGMWFTLLPLVEQGLKNAWRLAGVLGTFDVHPFREELAALLKPRLWSTVSWILLVPKLLLVVGTVYLLGQKSIVRLLPVLDTASFASVLNDLLIWVTGWCVLTLALWYVPRGILAAQLALGTIPHHLIFHGVTKPLTQVLQRKLFVAVGAAVGFFAALLAYFAPILDADRNIGALMPILRDNFWLTVHVLTITASYGAGALAWGLGNIALAYYLFGSYRDPEPSPGRPAADDANHAGDKQRAPRVLKRRAPDACSVLAGFIYKAIQVAVLLLAVGTILGALWADVAWGRFWGWDAKEVWALISLLVYMIILHGRYAGWAGNFGLVFGSVLGLTMIVMAWYGVNYVLRSGLHTYAGGSGGQLYVGMVIAGNWLFLGVAAVRYLLETRATVEVPGEPSLLPATSPSNAGLR